MNKIKEDISYKATKNINISYNDKKKYRYFIQRQKNIDISVKRIKCKISTFQKSTI